MAQSKSVRLVTEAALDTSNARERATSNAMLTPVKNDIAALKDLGGLTPGDVNDATTANLIETPGTDTANALSAAIGESVALQADYVGTLARLSNYATVEVTKTSADNALSVACVSPSGDKVIYGVTSGNRYQYVAGVDVTGGLAPVQTKAFRFDEMESTGTFLAQTTSPYATTVGATFTAVVKTTGGSVVNFRRYSDTRGGLWRLYIVEEPSITANVTTWSEAAVVLFTDELTIPNAGTWTIRGEFLGEDPAGAYTDAARGWVGSVNSGSGYTLSVTNTLSEDVATTRLSPVSNKDFAFMIRQPGVGNYEFVPYHGTASEAFASPTKYYDGGAPLDVAAMSVGEVKTVASFEIVQHIYGRNSTASNPDTNLIEVWTKQRINPDGTYTVTGRWKALVDIESNWSSYTMMLMGSMPLFDQVVSTVSTHHEVDPSQAPANLWLANESDTADGYALLSSTDDVVAAVRFDNRRETLRVGKPDKRAASSRGFIELRTGGTMAKIYNSIFATGTIVPVNTINRFEGAYFYGRIPGVYETLSLT